MFPNSPNIRVNLLKLKGIPDSIGNKNLELVNSKEVVGINFSITSKEFYESKKENTRIDIAVKIHVMLYDGSKYADINKVIYKIERTYVAGQFIELYLSEATLKKGDIIGYS